MQEGPPKKKKKERETHTTSATTEITTTTKKKGLPNTTGVNAAVFSDSSNFLPHLSLCCVLALPSEFFFFLDNLSASHSKKGEGEEDLRENT